MSWMYYFHMCVLSLFVLSGAVWSQVNQIGEVHSSENCISTAALKCVCYLKEKTNKQISSLQQTYKRQREMKAVGAVVRLVGPLMLNV